MVRRKGRDREVHGGNAARARGGRPRPVRRSRRLRGEVHWHDRCSFRESMKSGPVVMLVLGGCIGNPQPSLQDIAHRRAVADLRCPTEQVAVYDAVDGSTVAQGCGAWTQYECFDRVYGVTPGPHGSHGHRVHKSLCVREAPAQINGSPPSPVPPSAPPAPAAPQVLEPETRAPDPYQ
jgi:hypothetical protein